MAAPTPPGWGPPTDPPPATGWGPPVAPTPPWAGQQPYGQPVFYQRETPGTAIAALVLGIVALVVCLPLGWLPGGIALYLGGKSKRQIDADPLRYDGRAMALAGQITGGIATGIGILIDVFYILIIVVAFAGTTTSGT